MPVLLVPVVFDQERADFAHVSAAGADRVKRLLHARSVTGGAAQLHEVGSHQTLLTAAGGNGGQWRIRCAPGEVLIVRTAVGLLQVCADHSVPWRARHHCVQGLGRFDTLPVLRELLHEGAHSGCLAPPPAVTVGSGSCGSAPALLPN